MRKFNKEKLEKVATALIDALELDLHDPNFVDTPSRIARMYDEICLPKEEIEEQVKTYLSKTFPSQYDGMVISRGIRAYSVCGHHLLPIILDVTLAYIPTDKVLGLSKLARVAVTMAKRPLIQEDYTRDLARIMMAVLQPKGVGIYVEGVHYCQTMRGAMQQDAKMITTEVLGCFRDDEKTRSEFFVKGKI